MQVEAPASDWSVPIIAAKYFIRTKLYQSFYQYLKRSHEQIHSSDESTEHTAAHDYTRYKVSCEIRVVLQGLRPPSADDGAPAPISPSQ